MKTIDYLVVILYLAALLGIGWRFRTGQESGREYFLAGRRMGYFPIGLSVMVTSFSAINFLALPGGGVWARTLCAGLVSGVFPVGVAGCYVLDAPFSPRGEDQPVQTS